MQAPAGYVSWQGWLAGKAFPLAIFTLFLVMNGLALPREVMQVIGKGIWLYPVMELLRQFLNLGFLLLVIAAYLTRTHAVDPAQGFWQKVFPMLVLLATLVGMSFLESADGHHRLELVAMGLLLTLIGFCCSLWALWHLRASFGIMAEARSPVMSGPYKYVRHPLYLGEGLSMLGLCLAIGTATALSFWAVWTAMQLARGYIEENKLACQFDDYRVYRERTWFIFPGFY